MPDGGPQMTETWVTTDDQERLVINTVAGFQKVRNTQRDPRVALTIADPQAPARCCGIRGRVVAITAVEIDPAAGDAEVLAAAVLAELEQTAAG